MDGKKRITIFGENHSSIYDFNDQKYFLNNSKPDIVVLEHLRMDKVYNKSEARERLNGRATSKLGYNSLEEGWNEPYYKLAVKHNIPFIGCDIDDEHPDFTKTYGTPDKFRKKSLKEQFLIREERMLSVIDEVYNDDTYRTIMVILGDTHLRTIKTSQLGDVSPIYLKYSKLSNASILRSSSPEIK